MARVLYRPRASVDVDEIWDYIAEASMDQADKWVDRLVASLYLLSTQPRMGRSREELATGLRSYPFERYVVFYVPLVDGVDVVRVLHSARDIDAAFAALDQDS